jgi:hypothetical protein
LAGRFTRFNIEPLFHEFSNEYFKPWAPKPVGVGFDPVGFPDRLVCAATYTPKQAQPPQA